MREPQSYVFDETRNRPLRPDFIYTQFITRFNWEQGAAFGFLLLVLSTAIVWLGLTLTGQRFGDVMRRS